MSLWKKYYIRKNLMLAAHWWIRRRDRQMLKLDERRERRILQENAYILHRQLSDVCAAEDDRQWTIKGMSPEESRKAVFGVANMTLRRIATMVNNPLTD